VAGSGFGGLAFRLTPYILMTFAAHQTAKRTATGGARLGGIARVNVAAAIALMAVICAAFTPVVAVPAGGR
jgi:hypothetical protein